MQGLRTGVICLLMAAGPLVLATMLSGQQPAKTAPEIPEADVRVTTLTTNAADTVGQGEWSFAAWIEVGQRAFLFDTGWSPTNVLSNATALGIDLSIAEDLILSHHHGDHTGGLLTLRTELSKRNPNALSRIHVAAGIFASRPRPDGTERNPMVALRARLEASGATFILYDRPSEIAPGVWVTGPVPRLHDEQNYPVGPTRVVVQEERAVPDLISESQSLVVLAPEGPILVSGCGHAGLINTLEHARSKISARPPQAAIGGFHIFAASEKVLTWTAERLAAMKLGHFLGSHCTGFESVYRIRALAGMTSATAKIGAVGTRYESGRGIVPGAINR